MARPPQWKLAFDGTLLYPRVVLVTRREDLEGIREELAFRVSEHMLGRGNAAEILEESIYFERRRIAEDRGSPARESDRAFWEELSRRLRKAPEHEHPALLREAVEHFGQEIEGHFDSRIYALATRALPSTLGVVLNAVSPSKLFRRLPKVPSLDDCVTIEGETEHLRRLREKGTVILVPTHSSNLDSIVMGYSLYRLGLPPFVYGAGLNLFRNRLIGFFMHNLGAYTVDRKKQDPLYKEVLKAYATLTLEFGYDNLFFPGGTRSRAGAVERKLKLGLLGTGLSAYIKNLARKADEPNIYIVPATLNYQLVLEAETLIDDFLSAVGKSRYIIEDDEFSQPRTVLGFMSKLVSLDAKITLRIARGLDPFGNPVDDDGQSLDPAGRPIDIERYTWVDGRPEEDPARDAEYVSECASRICEAFSRENVVENTHILARSLFDALRARNPQLGVFKLIRTRGLQDQVPAMDLHERVDGLLSELRELEREGRIRLGSSCRGSAADIVAGGLATFETYHSRPAAERHGDRIGSGDPTLLLFYQNRLEGYALGRHRPVLTSDHRSLRSEEQ